MNKTTRPRFSHSFPVLFSALLLATTFLAACSTPDPEQKVFDTGDNGRTIQKEMGRHLRVRVLNNPDAGAQWQIAELDRSVLELMRPPRVEGKVVVGALAKVYTYEYDFEGIREGTAHLVMKLVKKDSGEVLDTLDITFVIQGGKPSKHHHRPTPPPQEGPDAHAHE